MNFVYFKSLLIAIMVGAASVMAFSQTKYQAPHATTAPVIDGLANDACWSKATWNDINYLWALSQPTPADFSGKFKVCWDENKLYILAEITDDVLNDHHTDPLSNYWEDDTWEIFIDEDRSGGNHETNYNAFAYHISRYFDIADIGSDGQARLFNDHASVARTENGTTYIWEAAFDVYTDTYSHNTTNNTKATLTAGKIMGFAMAYCDNDGGPTRQSFVGSEDIPGSNKNIAWQTADVFGSLELVENITPKFSHVLVASGLQNPTVFTMASDGRIFVGEQAGRVRVIKNGQLLSTPALTISVNLDGSGGYTERGLIGITLDPDFENNNYIYIFYTTNQNGIHNRVSRFTLNGDVVVAGSEVILLELDPLSSAFNHNGGALHFGVDGKLYIATGDNASGSNSQNLDNTHGKILRINPDGTIPSDNPFTTGTNQRKMIWAYGLRNPFTFDVQSETGRIYVNDVGQESWEEINDATLPGKNFGWPTAEGNSNNTSFTNPVFAYQHTLNSSETMGCAITGGCFYNPVSTNYPGKYIGKYFFMDFCNDWIAVLDPATGTRTEVFATNISSDPVAIDVHADGNLYYLTRSSGAVYKITYSGNPSPDILYHPESQSIPESQPVTFKVQASGAVPLSYQWQKDGEDIAGATSATYTIPYVLPENAGSYRVIVTNTHGSATSNEAILTVTEFNSRPVATITSPANLSKFSGGQTIIFNGSITDAEDGTLPASSYTWRVDLHHDDHVHDGIPQSGVSSLQFTVPTSGETSDNIWYRIYLIATDNGGLKDTTYIELLPNKVHLTLNSDPEGLTLTLDGQPVQTPHTVLSVVGMERTIGVISPQSGTGNAWRFLNWSDGGSATHIIHTPDDNTTYLATFEEAPVTNESASPIHDAYVQSNTEWIPDGQTTAFGSTNPTQLVTKNYTQGPNRITYLTFDLSQLAGNPSNLQAAKLKLNGSVEDGSDPSPKTIVVDIFEASSTEWNENTITWNNRPAIGTTVLGSQTVSGITAANYEWDLTSFIKSKLLAGETKISLAMVNRGDNFYRIYFNSKEATTDKPTLSLEYVEVVTAATDSKPVSLFSIYPNPARKQLILEYQSVGGNEAEIEIVDQISRTCHKEKVPSTVGRNLHTINISGLKPGIYFIYYKAGDAVQSKKLVVE